MSKIKSLSTTQSKETIYIDVDDEITAIIDKVTGSKSKILALVLPKRASMLQSVVNMRLLKRSADQASKNIVLVTSESSLMPLAGLAGLHVAATPTSKPSIPDGPDSAKTNETESIDESLNIVDNSADSDETADFDKNAEADTPVGELSGAETESILMPDEPAPEAAADAKPAKKAVADKPNPKLKVPNFRKFKLVVIFGILAVILLGVGGYFALVVMPKAGIAITTDSTTVNTEVNVNLDTAATKVDKAELVLPAVAQTVQKTLSQDAPATGQENNGKKASGEVEFSATACAPNIRRPSSIPTGSTISAGGKTYITQETASFSIDGSSGSCTTYVSNDVSIIALKPGTAYNVPSGTKFGGAGIAVGSASGGTDDISKIVTQADIDAAKDKIDKEDTAAIKKDLATALEAKNLVPVEVTFSTGDKQFTSSVQAGAKADSVKVTAVVPFNMLGVSRDDLKTIILAQAEKELDTKKQEITDDGVDKATFAAENPASATAALVKLKARSTAGPELSRKAIAADTAGMKEADVKAYLTEIPGVTEVEVHYSPIWVTRVPKNPDKVSIYIDGSLE